MPYYENVFIARQDISASAAEALGERFTTVIKENGGEVTKKEYWGLKNLAYRIKKNRKGHYVLFNIDAPWSAVQEMERQMRINEDVLRFLTLKVDELEAGPSVVMQHRPGREERGRREGREERGRREGREGPGRREGREGRGRHGRGEDQGADTERRGAREEGEAAAEPRDDKPSDEEASGQEKPEGGEA
jgi:small subunit ribosomal protein S6